jgi:hypothetical protein
MRVFTVKAGGVEKIRVSVRTQGKASVTELGLELGENMPPVRTEGGKRSV